MTEKELKQRVSNILDEVSCTAPRLSLADQFVDLFKEAGTTFDPEVEVAWEGSGRVKGYRERLLSDGTWQFKAPEQGAKWHRRIDTGDGDAELARRLLAERAAKTDSWARDAATEWARMPGEDVVKGYDSLELYIENLTDLILRHAPV